MVAARLVGLMLIAACSNKAESETHVPAQIAPTSVTLENVERYEEQVRQELPIGTPKEAVEAYLRRIAVTHSFVPASAVNPFGNTFNALIENIGRTAVGPGLFANANLEIHVHLDDNERVDRIEFNVVVDAP